MPDFERVFDKLRVDLARTPEDKAHALGFIAGKNFARKQLLWVVIFTMAIAGYVVIHSYYF